MGLFIVAHQLSDEWVKLYQTVANAKENKDN